jgi:hypothetical protein
MSPGIVAKAPATSPPLLPGGIQFNLLPHRSMARKEAIFALSPWKVLAPAFVALVFSGCSTTDDPGSDSGSGDCVSTACKLATVEEGTFVAPDDPLVDDYQAGA